jgi:hypothetical protein
VLFHLVPIHKFVGAFLRGRPIFKYLDLCRTWGAHGGRPYNRLAAFPKTTFTAVSEQVDTDVRHLSADMLRFNSMMLFKLTSRNRPIRQKSERSGRTPFVRSQCKLERCLKQLAYQHHRGIADVGFRACA